MGTDERITLPDGPKTVGISGASGFIGSHLSAFLTARGYRTIPLPRELFADGAEGSLHSAVSGCDVIINLAGAPIDHRWTPAYKKTLYDSRVATTRKLVAAIDRSPRVVLLHSTSAVGFYPSTGRMPETFGVAAPSFSDSAYSNRGFGHPFRKETGPVLHPFLFPGHDGEATPATDSLRATGNGGAAPGAENDSQRHNSPRPRTETGSRHACFDEGWTTPGPGFLAGVCAAWEAEARRVNPRVRLVISRFGVVLDSDGGAFPRLALPARWKLAVTVGPGSQPFPWIDLQDLMGAVAFLMERPQLHGVFNFVAPGLVTQRELTRQIAGHYRSWLRVTVPQWIFRLLRGESSEFLTRGQCVLPDRLLHEGFTFRSPRIGDFLGKL